MPIMNYKTFMIISQWEIFKTIDNIIIKKTALFNKCNLLKNVVDMIVKNDDCNKGFNLPYLLFYFTFCFLFCLVLN